MSACGCACPLPAVNYLCFARKTYIVHIICTFIYLFSTAAVCIVRKVLRYFYVFVDFPQAEFTRSKFQKTFSIFRMFCRTHSRSLVLLLLLHCRMYLIYRVWHYYTYIPRATSVHTHAPCSNAVYLQASLNRCPLVLPIMVYLPSSLSAAVRSQASATNLM